MTRSKCPWTADLCWDHFRRIFLLLSLHRVSEIVLRFIHRERNKLADFDSKEASKEPGLTAAALATALPGVDFEAQFRLIDAAERGGSIGKVMSAVERAALVSPPRDVLMIQQQLDIVREDDFSNMQAPEHLLRFKLKVKGG